MRPSLVLISCLAGTSAFPVTHSIAPEAASTYKAIVASWVSAMSRPSNTFIGSSLSGTGHEGPSQRRFKSRVRGKFKALEEGSGQQLQIPTVQQPELDSPAAKHSGGQKKECNGSRQEAKHSRDSKDQVNQAAFKDPGEQGGCSSFIRKSKGPGGGGFLDLPPAAEPIVDVGVNLCHKSFQKSLPDIIKRALHAKVTRMVSELLSSTLNCNTPQHLKTVSLTQDSMYVKQKSWHRTLQTVSTVCLCISRPCVSSRQKLQGWACVPLCTIQVPHSALLLSQPDKMSWILRHTHNLLILCVQH